MINLPFDTSQIVTRLEAGKPKVFDLIRKKWLIITPEEWVRQLLLHYLFEVMSYPKEKCAVEKTIEINKLKYRFDAVLYDANMHPWMIIECKAPNIPITEDTLHQLLQYHHYLQARYWLLSNGSTTLCADASALPNIVWLQDLPPYQ